MSKKGSIRNFKLTLEEADPALREYTDEEIQRLLEEDKLDPEIVAEVRRLLEKSTFDDILPSDGVRTQVRLKTRNE